MRLYSLSSILTLASLVGTVCAFLPHGQRLQAQPADADVAISLPVEVELLSDLKGSGALLGLVSGFRDLKFGPEQNETVIEAFISFVSGNSAESEITQNIPNTIQFMRDRFNTTPADTDAGPADTLTLQTIGYMLANQSGLGDMGFNNEEISEIASGLRYALDADKDMAAIRAEIPNVQKFLAERAQKAAAAGLEKRREEMAAFFAKIAQEEGVQKDESGFYYKIVREGEDPKPTSADSVEVHYRGTLIDGTQFDSSYERGAPSTFPMNGVIPGFSGGLSKIGVGGKIFIYIPSELGYGDNPRGGGVIRPGDALIFECELFKVNP